MLHRIAGALPEKGRGNNKDMNWSSSASVRSPLLALLHHADPSPLSCPEHDEHVWAAQRSAQRLKIP
jgi:hypothetical protein